MGQATAMNNGFRNVGDNVSTAIAGSPPAMCLLTGGPFARLFPTHQAFQYATFISAGITVTGSVTVAFAQGILGGCRHTKFAHLPTLTLGSRGKARSY